MNNAAIRKTCNCLKIELWLSQSFCEVRNYIIFFIYIYLSVSVYHIILPVHVHVSFHVGIINSSRKCIKDHSEQSHAKFSG